MIYQVLERDYEKVVGITSHGNVYGYKNAYYEFCENGYIEYCVDDIIEKNGVYTYVPGENAPHRNDRMFSDWENVVIQLRDIQSEKYVGFDYPFSSILIKKTDIKEIQEFYSKRNNERHQERKKLVSYVDDGILDIAENLVNMIEENVMTNQYIIALSQKRYSHIKFEEIFGQDIYKKSTFGLKGKEKKETEKFNAELQEQFKNLSTIIDNFVEIIMEEKQLKAYVARAVAWEAIQRKAIEYYAQLWKEEYEIHLQYDFDELKEKLIGRDTDAIEREYIRNVILSDEVDILDIRFVLIYYLISKNNYYELSLYDSFLYQAQRIQEEEDKVKTSDIKLKLRTKQHRRVNKYTMDDVDLMTGAEFEEFVGLLFKKMGYSSRVTKQSGDQGLDVIALKNGKKIGIQAKCYSGTVGNSAVQEAVAGKSFYSCDKVIVITNNYFTPAAIELAQSNDVILWNRDMLKEKIRELM